MKGQTLPRSRRPSPLLRVGALLLLAFATIGPAPNKVWDLKVTSVLTRKLENGKWVATNTFRDREQIRIDCWFSYASFGTLEDMNDWIISFRWDGQHFEKTPGSGANNPSNAYLRSVFHKAEGVGPHTVGCLLNYGGFLDESENGNNSKLASILVIPLTPYVGSTKGMGKEPLVAKAPASIGFAVRGYPEVNLKPQPPYVTRAGKMVQEAWVGENLKIGCNSEVNLNMIKGTTVQLPPWKYRVMVDGVILAEPPGQTKFTSMDIVWTSADWKPAAPGSKTIECQIDPFGKIAETNELDNNRKGVVKILSHSRVAPEAGSFRAMPVPPATPTVSGRRSRG
jgi:hypothetical protein